jgi:hypothetical protein
MTANELGQIVWHKSSYSAGNGACVEMGWPDADQLAVRDSKAPQTGTLAFGAADWQAFLGHVRG